MARRATMIISAVSPRLSPIPSTAHMSYWLDSVTDHRQYVLWTLGTQWLKRSGMIINCLYIHSIYKLFHEQVWHEHSSNQIGCLVYLVGTINYIFVKETAYWSALSCKIIALNPSGPQAGCPVDKIPRAEYIGQSTRRCWVHPSNQVCYCRTYAMYWNLRCPEITLAEKYNTFRSLAIGVRLALPIHLCAVPNAPEGRLRRMIVLKEYEGQQKQRFWSAVS